MVMMRGDNGTGTGTETGTILSLWHFDRSCISTLLRVPFRVLATFSIYDIMTECIQFIFSFSARYCQKYLHKERTVQEFVSLFKRTATDFSDYVSTDAEQLNR